MKHLICATFGLFTLGTAAQACPDYNISANEIYEASGTQLYEARYFGVVAGGENYVWDCRNVTPQTDTGAGYFPSTPDFRFYLSGMGSYQLEISVVSNCDAALLINTATGGWYYDDDDNGNYDPRIYLTRPQNGAVDIWIGTYDGDYCDANLKLETFKK